MRITGLEGAGASAKWDGTVDLTPRSELTARARGLAPRATTADVQAQPAAALASVPASTAAPKRAKKAAATDAMVEQPVSETPAEGAQTSVDADAATQPGSMASEAAPKKKPRAKKAAASTDEIIARDTAVLGDDEPA